MGILQQGIITLMRSGLTGEKLPLPESFDLEAAYPQLVRHQIHPLCYVGAVNCGVDKKLPTMQKLFQGYLKCLMYSEGQMNAVERICAAFDAAGIDYMPLKGCNLKKLYPKPELRLMGDADVLIRVEQYNVVRSIMKTLEFEEQKESDHELIWNSCELHLELHKRLIPSYNKDYYRYFGNGWQLAKVCSGTWYGMTREDEYIYLFTHFAKHYRDGGIGCRHVTDLWVWRKAYPQMDEAYIATELDKLQLLEFECNMQRVTAAWFEGAQPDEKTQFITDFVFQSGAWGEHSSQILAAAVKETKSTKTVLFARVKRMWKLAFIPYLHMKQKYPILKKLPILLPVFWAVRIVDVLVLTRGKWERHKREFLYTKNENLSEYQQALHYVGLDFHFKEG